MHNPTAFAIIIMNFIFVLICFFIIKNNKNKKFILAYKILILIMTICLYISFKNYWEGETVYNFAIFIAIIEIFIRIFTKKK